VPQAGPLPGAYRRSALPVLERRLRAGDLALTAALVELETCVIEVDPNVLANVNRPQDLPPAPTHARGSRSCRPDEAIALRDERQGLS
jgi:molybdopterin-guanine dinucleotide biosynthesis protein A